MRYQSRETSCNFPQGLALRGQSYQLKIVIVFLVSWLRVAIGALPCFAYGIGTGTGLPTSDQVPVHQYIAREAARLWSDPSGEILKRVGQSNDALPAATTFRWSVGVGASRYSLDVGTSFGTNDLYTGQEATGVARAVAGLPTVGRTVYVRLGSFVNGTWYYNHYTYTSETSVKAGILFPSPGSKLLESAAYFGWTGGAAASEYWLAVGTSHGAADLYDQSQGLNREAHVTGLPNNGSTFYVRLWTRFLESEWQYNDYAYTAVGGAADFRAALISPPPGVLPSWWIDESGQAGYDPGDDILLGSKEEDEEPIPSPSEKCGDDVSRDGVPGLNGYVEHFWEPDDPVAGGRGDGYNCNSIGGGYNGGLSLISAHNGVHFDSSYRLAQYYWDYLVVPAYPDGSQEMREKAYYWLGRIAHLLADMSVPAHVHDDPHPVADSYENYFKTDPLRITEWTADRVREEVGVEYQLDALPNLTPGIWSEVHADGNPPPLFRLFWYVAQKTQYAWSDEKSGNAHYLTLAGESKTFDPHLWTGEGFSDKTVPVLASHLIPHSIRAVAGLYRLFWETVQPLPPDNTAPGVPIDMGAAPAGWTNANSFTVSWTNPSDPSGIAAAWYKRGTAPTSATDGTRVAGSNIQTLPGIQATAQGGQPIFVWLEDGAENRDHANRASTTLWWDGTAPTAGTLSVNNGAASTASLLVTLNSLGATETLSGLSQMRFSNDNSIWCAWESYATTRANWDLSQYGGNTAAGAKTVYVQYRDTAGNVSTSFCRHHQLRTGWRRH